MIRIVMKSVLAILVSLVVSFLLFVNVRLYDTPASKVIQGDTVNLDVLHELRGLGDALHDGAADKMQTVYPEGYVFFTALYGLGWADFATTVKHDPTRFREALRETNAAYQLINTPHARRTFNEDLKLPYGAFYNGWSNQLLERKLQLENPDNRDANEVAEFKQRCEAIAVSLQTAVYPESYHQAAWPADAMLCVSTLALHDKIFEPHYRGIINHWLANVRKHLDVRGLIPHRAHPFSGKPLEEARGSSQSLMLIFLAQLDEAFAREQFALYEEHFVDTRFGLPGVREYAKGSFGIGDVDSGPIVLQMGPAATIVGMRTLDRYGKHCVSFAMRNSLEGFGLGWTTDDRKHHLFGMLPIADAFLAWSHAGCQFSTTGGEPRWRAWFQVFSGLLSGSLAAGLFWYLKRKKPPRDLVVHWGEPIP